MCGPLVMAIGGLAISAAQTVIGYVGQMQQYRAQMQYYADNAARADADMKRGYISTQRRMIQEEAAAAAERQEVAREARAARARALTAAGEAGVSGLSVDALLADYYGREATYMDQSRHQIDWTHQQLMDSMHGIRSVAEDRINSVPKPVKPSFIDAGLRIAGAGMNTYTQYRKWTT
jgi:hypothetical protein